MKKRKNRRQRWTVVPVALLGAMLLLGGCSAADGGGDFSAPDEVKSVDGQTALGIETAWLESSVATRSMSVVAIPDKSTIGVFRRKDEANAYAAADNVAYQIASGAWNVVTAGKNIFLHSLAAKLGAYYPYDATQTTTGGLMLTNRPWSADKEYVYAPATANSSYPNVSFTMTHAYSRMGVTFKRHDSYPTASKGKVTTMGFAGTGVYATALLDVSKALVETPYLYSIPGSTLNVDRTASRVGVADESKADQLDLLMLPYTLKDEIILSATVDGKKMSLPVDAAKFGGKLSVGTRYNVVLTIYPTGLKLSSVKFAGWDETPLPGDGFDTTFQ